MILYPSRTKLGTRINNGFDTKVDIIKGVE